MQAAAAAAAAAASANNSKTQPAPPTVSAVSAKPSCTPLDGHPAAHGGPASAAPGSNGVHNGELLFQAQSTSNFLYNAITIAHHGYSFSSFPKLTSFLLRI